MNVLIVNQYAIPPSQAGITRHYMLARVLVRLGHSVTIVASSFDHVTRRETRLRAGEAFAVEEIEGVNFLWVRTPPYGGNGSARIRNMLAFTWAIWRGVGLKSCATPDVILGSSPHLFAAFGASHLADRLGVPFVLEVRDLWPQSLIDLGDVPPYSPFVLALGSLERILYRRADRIVVLLPAAFGHIAAKGGSEEKITWIPNGVDLSAYPLQSTTYEQAPNAREVFTVMYAGTHGFANALDSILDAAALLKDDASPRILFRFLGDGPQKQRLIERAAAMNLVNVSFEAPVPKLAVPAVIMAADAFVVTLRDIPLYSHGTSLNKLFDYMAAGKPIVIGTSEVDHPVVDARCGLRVDPEDSAGMAEALRSLARASPQERAAMGVRGRQYVAKHHDIAALGEKLEAVLIAAKVDRSAPKLAPT